MNNKLKYHQGTGQQDTGQQGTGHQEGQETRVAETQKATPQVLQDSERQVCEVWTRVMGYHRPVHHYNLAKQGEFSDRAYFRWPTP